MIEQGNDGDARIIGLKEASKLLGVSYTTAFRLVQDGELRAFRIRNAWRTSTAACDEFVKRKFDEQALICQSVEMK